MKANTIKAPLARLKQKKDITDLETAERNPEIDAMLAEAMAELRAGKVSPKFKNVKEMIRWFRTKEGKNF